MRKSIIAIVALSLSISGLGAAAHATSTVVATPHVVADMNQNLQSTYLKHAIEFNGALYAGGEISPYGNELIKVDLDNTVQLALDVNASGSSSPQALTVYRGKLFFIAFDSDGNQNLYSYSSAGTLTTIGRIASANNTQWNVHIAIYNNLLYTYRLEQSGVGSGEELWVYDGTTWARVTLPGSELATPNTGLNTISFAIFNNKLYFAMPKQDGSYDTVLGVIGTNGIAALAPQTDGVISSPDSLTVFNGKLMMSAWGDGYSRFFIYDGVNAPLAASPSLEVNAYPDSFTEFKGVLYYESRDSQYNFRLWKYDGVNAPEPVTLPFGLADQPYYPQFFVEYNGRLYIEMQNVVEDKNSLRMISTDGTTYQVETVFGEISPSYQFGQAVFNNKLYANIPVGTGVQLVSFDGSNVTPVFSNSPATQSGVFDSTYGESSFAVTSSGIFFVASSGATSAIYKYDGSSSPVMVPGSEVTGNYQILTSVGDVLYAWGSQRVNNGIWPNYVWRYTGSGSMQELTNLESAMDINNNYPSEIMEFSGGALVRSYGGLYYLKNGILTTTPAGFSGISYGVIAGSYYYFRANGPSGEGIYKWNGTGDPTMFNNWGGYMSNFWKLFSVNGNVYAFAGEVEPVNHFVTGFYSLTQDGSTRIQEIDLSGSFGDTVSIGTDMYTIVPGFGSDDRLFQVSTTGFRQITSLPSQRISSVSNSNGKLAVGAMMPNGTLSTYILNSSDEIIERIDAGNEYWWMANNAVTYFNGHNYFAYNSPEFGLELATDGPAISASVPGAPTSLTIGTKTATTTQLSWTAPNSDGGRPIGTYNVEYSTNGNTWTPFRHLASTETSITVSGLTSGVSYQFRVKAHNMIGDGAASNIAISTVVKPTAPRSVKIATKNITKVSAIVTWSAPSTLGSGSITDYKVEYSTNGKKWTVVKHTASTARARKIIKLKTKTKYYVRVTAISTAGNSVASAKVSFKTK